LSNIVLGAEHLLGVGDAGLPQVSEIEHSGTTLEDMASGMLLEDPGSVAEEAETEAHTTTQSLVEEYGTSNLAISKLTGSLVFMGIEDAMSSTEEVETSTGINATEYETVGTSLPVDNSTGLPSWTAGEGMADPYWPFVENATDMSERDFTTSVSTSLTSAFAGLMEAGQASFTLSWWSKMDESFDMMFPELLFGSPQTDEIVFQASPHPPSAHHAYNCKSTHSNTISDEIRRTGYGRE
jgi:hypothetical protein